jgi:hypothetical protein
VLGRVGAEAASGLLQLPLAADTVAAAGLVPGHGDVDEALKEVALLGRRRAPGVFQLFVCGEELAAPDQV